MYNISKFEQLIKSDMTSDEVLYEILMNNYLVKTKKKYSNDESEPFAIYEGGIGRYDYVTVNNRLYPLKMSFDSKDIYTRYIEQLRKRISESDESFRDLVFTVIKEYSKDCFYMEETPIEKKHALLANFYKEKYKTSAKQRDSYAFDRNVGTFNEEKGETVYNISSFIGTGDLAKCVEINSVACNLLCISGYPSVLAQGYFTNYKNESDEHTFTLYKGESGKYCLFDCTLKLFKEDIMDGDINFEEGINLQIPCKVTYPDGKVEESNIKYSVSPQKLCFDSEKNKKTI